MIENLSRNLIGNAEIFLICMGKTALRAHVSNRVRELSRTALQLLCSMEKAFVFFGFLLFMNVFESCKTLV